MPTDLAPPPETNLDPGAASFIAGLEASGDFGPPPETKPAENAPETPPATPPRQPDGKFTAKPADAIKPTQPSVKPTEAPTGPKELRQQYETTKAERDALRAEKETLANRAKELESKIAEAEKLGKATGALEAKLAAIEKEKDELRGELTKHRFEASKEFKDRYEAPFKQAADEAAQFLGELDRVDKGDDSKGTLDDLVTLYRLPIGQASAKAREMFGDEVAPMVVAEIRRVKQLDNAQTKALEAEKSGWQTKVKEQEGQAALQHKQRIETWQKIRTELADTVPDYKDAVDDKEAIEARNKAYAILDRQETDPAKQMVKNGHILHRAAAFDVLKLQNARKDARIKALESELVALKPGQPNPGGRKPGGAEPEGKAESWEDGLRRAVQGA